MILNTKFNATAQKILWAEAVHMCIKVRQQQAVLRARLKFSMVKNLRSLVRSQSSDVLRMSRRGKY